MPAAVAIPAAVSAGTSILGGVLGSKASKNAAATQAAAAQKVVDMAKGVTSQAQDGVSDALKNANQRQDEALHMQQAALNPYLKAGEQGINSFAAMLAPGGELTQKFAFSPADFKGGDEFNFLMSQGTEALKRSAAATGSLGNGGTLKALTQFGQGLASTQYGAAYDRAAKTFQTNHDNTVGDLNKLIGFGQTATNQQNGALQNWTNQSGNNWMRAAEYSGDAGLRGLGIEADAITGGANAQAAGTVGAANSWNSAFGGIANAAQYAGMASIAQQNGTTPPGFTPYSQGKPFNPSPATSTKLPNFAPGFVPGTSGSYSLPSWAGVGAPVPPQAPQANYTPAYYTPAE